MGCPQPVSFGGFRFCPECGHLLRLRDRFIPHRMLGQGGFGRTVLATDLDRPSHPLCVIKQFLPLNGNREQALKARELFAREAKLLEQLGDHPQIPRLYAYFEQEDGPYLVQEYVAGRHLGAELAQEGAFSAAAILAVLRGILPVLAFLHNRGVIHRDVKPENIIRRAGDGTLILVDFGAGKEEVSSEVIATRVGTPQFAAPEQLMGRPVPASDLYALGVTCIHLWTGCGPAELFDAYSGQWVWRCALKDGFDPRLGAVVDRLLHGPLQLRYASAAAVLGDLMSVSVAPPCSHDGLTVSSESDDYARLVALMDGDLWQEADHLTWDLLCTAAAKVVGSYLFVADVAVIPCAIWLRLDRLWRSHSGERFGWSVRQEIFESVGRNYGQLCWQIGWRQRSAAGRSMWLSGDHLNYDRSAPRGHLPWINGFYGHEGACGEQDLMVTLGDRLIQCLKQQG
ncbi:MAG: protein kinase [Oscillatoriales cyanobacterium SM2_2_1]|nr:protein kinase [Oscillatoriales cyanobacterium SM2_2_1]